MEEAAEVGHEDQGSLGRVMAKAVPLGAASALGAYGWSGQRAAFGAAIGALGAGVYAWSYLRSHLARRERERAFDPALARQAAIRLAAAVAAGAGVYVLGRPALLGFLAAFGAAFAVIVVTELPRMARHVKALGGRP